MNCKVLLISMTLLLPEIIMAAPGQIRGRFAPNMTTLPAGVSRVFVEETESPTKYVGGSKLVIEFRPGVFSAAPLCFIAGATPSCFLLEESYKRVAIACENQELIEYGDYSNRWYAMETRYSSPNRVNVDCSEFGD